MPINAKWGGAGCNFALVNKPPPPVLPLKGEAYHPEGKSYPLATLSFRRGAGGEALNLGGAYF